MSQYDGQVPGPKIEEVDSGDRPITGVSVDVGSMLIETLKGPLTTQLMKDFAEFVRVWGGQIEGSDGAYEAEQFFKEGGNDLYVGRLIHRTTQSDPNSYDATVGTFTASDGANDTVKVDASSPGEWSSIGATALSIVLADDPQHPAATAGSDFTADVAAGAVEATVVTKKGLRVGSLAQFSGSGNTEYRVLTGVSSAVVGAAVVHTIQWAVPLWYPYTTAASSKLTSQEFSIEVRENGVTVEANSWTNLTLTAGDARYAETIVNDENTGSQYIAVDDLDPEVVATGNIDFTGVATAGDLVTLFPGTDIATVFTCSATPTTALEYQDGAAATAIASLLVAIQGAGLPLTAVAGGGDDIDLTMDSGYGSVANVAITKTGTNTTVTGMASGASGPGEDLPTPTTPGSAELLLGGTNGSAITDADILGDEAGQTGYHMFDKVRINMVSAPGQTSAAAVVGGVVYCEGRIDCYFVGDAPKGYGRDALVTYVEDTLGLDTTKAVVLGDWDKVFDPLGSTSNPIREIPTSGQYMGVAARAHAQPPPDGQAWQAPAGTGVYGKLTTSLGRVAELSEADIGIINDAGIIGVINKDGFGDLFWGARMPTSSADVKYITQRTTLIFIELAILDGTLDLTFKNNEIQQNRMGKQIVNRVSSFLRQVRKDGGLAGKNDEDAFFVVSDSTTTTQPMVDVGVRITNIGVALQTPGEFLVFRLRRIAPGQQVIEEV